MPHTSRPSAALLHRTRRYARLLLASTLLVTGACGDAVGPAPSLTGSWSTDGPGSTAATGVPITLALSQDGDVLTATGSFVHPQGASVALTAHGNVFGDVVMLTIESDGLLAPLLYQAVLDDGGNRMVGTMTQSQSSEPRVFVRE